MIILRCLDVGVDNHGDAAMGGFDFCVHLRDLFRSKVLGIKHEVLVTLRVRVLISPFNIHPEHIDREAIACEISITLHEHLSTDVGPLAEVETQHVDRGQRYKA